MIAGGIIMIKRLIFCLSISILFLLSLNVSAQEREGYPSFSQETIKYENTIS